MVQRDPNKRINLLESVVKGAFSKCLHVFGTLSVS